jgi:hypothetical protein
MINEILNDAFKDSIISTIKYLIKDDDIKSNLKFNTKNGLTMRYKYWEKLPDKYWEIIKHYVSVVPIDQNDEGTDYLYLYYIKPALINEKSVNTQLDDANELLNAHDKETNPSYYQGKITEYNEKWGINE